ncbi:MAG: hypothetical protein JWM41_1761 [Gemmatimonadetes bacterium]|nr:hypothetical protein [Gemmatimonadota bacterium]
MEPIGDSSPRYRARMAGVFYVLMLLSGGIGFVGRRGLIVTGDAAATATNILAHQSMYVLGFSGDVLVTVTYVVVVVLLYEMFRPVNRTAALLGAFLGLMACTIQAFATLFQLAPLTILGGARYLSVFTVEQLQAQAYMFLKLYSQAYGIALVFFAFCSLLTGYLIIRSTFLPHVLGVFMLIAGACWLTFLAPPFATKYFAFILPGAVGELMLMLWLLVKGVDAERWNEQARAPGRAAPA